MEISRLFFSAFFTDKNRGFRLNHSTRATEQIEFHLTRASNRLSVHAYRKVDDLGDGTYLFRYRLYESVENLHIYVRFGNEPIEYTIKGHLYSDGCYCPETNRTEWLNALECSSSSLTSQFKQDFKLFDKIDMKQVINKAKEKYFQHQQSYALCHYVIKNNKVTDRVNMNVVILCVSLLDRFIENVMANMWVSKCSPMRFYYHFLEK